MFRNVNFISLFESHSVVGAQFEWRVVFNRGGRELGGLDWTEVIDKGHGDDDDDHDDDESGVGNLGKNLLFDCW